MSLDEYFHKRRLSQTPEPRGSTSRVPGRRRFSFQRHDARRLHYDLRLEVGETLKSWAVPKGPSLTPGERKLAVRTEDHRWLTSIGKGSYQRVNTGPG